MGFEYGIGGFDSFDVFGVMFAIMFILVIGVFIVSIFTGIKTWNKNNNSPRLSVNARVVSKRIGVSHHHHHHHGNAGAHSGVHTASSTYYYVTFEVESGDRMELELAGHDYGMLAEGDLGKLSFQGTRYLGFEREMENRYDN